MRSRLFLAPGWMQGIIMGTYFGAVMAAITMFGDDEGWVSAVVSGIFGGIFFGGSTWWWSVRELARWRAVVGRDLSRAELRVVHRAASSGPIPTDAKLREASVRSAESSLKKRQDDYVLNLVTLGGFVVAVTAFAVLWSPWWLLGVPFLVYGTYESWSTPRSLRSRIQLLTAGQDQHPFRPS